MKIVRLTENNGKTAYFDNTFNDEIQLPPFSEVALSSTSINVYPDLLQVGDINRTFEESTVGTMTLARGVYNATNYQDLFDNITANLNDTVGADAITNAESNTPTPEVGIQWVCSSDSIQTGIGIEGKVSIGMRVANYEGADVEAFDNMEDKVEEVEDKEDPLNSKYSLVLDSDTGVLFSREPLTWGSGRFYMELETFTDPGDDDLGVFIGLTAISPATHEANGTQPIMSECEIGIRAVKPGAVYQLNQEGVDYPAHGAVGVNPVAVEKATIGFERAEGIIYAVQYTPAGVRHEMKAESEDIENTLEWGQIDSADHPLYPVIIFLSPAASATIDNIQLSPDAFSLYKNKTYAPIVATNGIVGMQCNGDNTEHYIDFSDGTKDKSLANFLGYNSNRNPVKGTLTFAGTRGNYLADNMFSSSVEGQGYYVEYMTGQLEGFDGTTHQRKNILAVIPESDKDNKLLFQPSFPTFLELNNKHPLTLRNVRVRVLQTDGSPLEVSGFNSLTLLYRTPK